METTLDDIQAAVIAANGKFPDVILRAFLPEKATLFGKALVPLTAGHHLVLVHLEHPLVIAGKTWQAQDIPLAMFVFTRGSKNLFQILANGGFEAEFYDFIESLPCAEMTDAIRQLIGHWLAATSTALAMESPHDTQKKTADSAGG